MRFLFSYLARDETGINSLIDARYWILVVFYSYMTSSNDEKRIEEMKSEMSSTT